MSGSPRDVGGMTKLLLVVLGPTLMLVATGVVPVDPARVHSAPAVLFATGTLFFLLGVLAFVAPRRSRFPGAAGLLLALLVSTGAALVALITFYSHDEQLAIGPFVFRGPAVDAFGKLVLGFDALLLIAAAAWCWRSWWRLRRTRSAIPTSG